MSQKDTTPLLIGGGGIISLCCCCILLIGVSITVILFFFNPFNKAAVAKPKPINFDANPTDDPPAETNYDGKSYSVMNENNCMEGDDASTSWHLKACQKGQAQNYLFSYTTDKGGYTLKNEASSKCLDASGSSVYYGPCQADNSYQSFLPNNDNQIVHGNSKQCLSAADGLNGLVSLATCDTSDKKQTWKMA